jgi:cyclopropane-fatty-acyl-phospholipid synthase
MVPPRGDRSVVTAARLLRRVFAGVDAPLAFRLWDGTLVRAGRPGECAFGVVFRSRAVFRRVLRRPTSLRFGEAFIDGEVDVEGDLFAALRAAGGIEGMRVPLATRLVVLAGLLRV